MKSSTAWLLGRLFAIGAVVTLLVLPGGATPVSDVPHRLGVAHSLLTGSPPLEGLQTTEPFVLRNRKGQATPWFGIGQSLVLMPADALATLAGARTPRQRFLAVEYLTFPIINGLVVAAACAFLIAAGFSAYAAASGAIALMLCSTLLWHFQNNQENPLQLLLVLVALTAALRWTATGSRRWLACMGACLGFDLLIRIPNAVDVVIVSAIPLLSARRRAYLREFVVFAAPGIAAGIAIDRIYHFARFGEWTTNYMQLFAQLAATLNYPVPAGFPFSNPFWIGMTGPFVSLQKSVFLFDPLLIATLAAMVWQWRRLRGIVRVLAIASMTGILMSAAGYARFYNWSAVSGWGDRFLTTWVWIGCLLAVPVLIELGARTRTLIAITAVAMSLQLCSIVLPSWLEEVQLGTQHEVVPGIISVPDERFDQFVIGQRIRNIAAFEHAPMVPVLMPFRTLPWWAGLLVRLSWFGTAIAVARSIRSVLHNPKRKI